MLITNIKGLVGVHPKEKLTLRGSELANLPLLENAWLLVENGLIKDFGLMSEIPVSYTHLDVYKRQIFHRVIKAFYDTRWRP